MERFAPTTASETPNKSQLRAAQQRLDAAIARLCARERTKREDYLRGAMPLPFADAAGLASALRRGEAEGPPGATAAPQEPRTEAPADGRRAAFRPVPRAPRTGAGPLPEWLGLMAAAGLVGLVVGASSHTALRASDVSATQEESASAAAISPVMGQFVPGAAEPAAEVVPEPERIAVATAPEPRRAGTAPEHPSRDVAAIEPPSSRRASKAPGLPSRNVAANAPRAPDPSARAHARRLLGRAQTALSQGALGDAAQMLRRYETEHPDDPFPGRRNCRHGDKVA